MLPFHCFGVCHCGVQSVHAFLPKRPALGVLLEQPVTSSSSTNPVPLPACDVTRGVGGASSPRPGALVNGGGMRAPSSGTEAELRHSTMLAPPPGTPLHDWKTRPAR